MYTLRLRLYGERWEPCLDDDGRPVLFVGLGEARWRAELLLTYQSAQAVQCREGRRLRHWWIIGADGTLRDLKAPPEPSAPCPCAAREPAPCRPR